MDMQSKLDKLRLLDKEWGHLGRIIAALQWDQETMLPEKAVPERAEQLALIEGILHERFSSQDTGSLLLELGSSTENPGGDEKLPHIDRDFLKIIRRNYDKAVKLPTDFVSNAARAEGLSQAAWVKARKENKFSDFLPHLVKMLDFARQRANYWGYKDNVYDGLLDIYEPGLGAEGISALFKPLGEKLSLLLKKISSAARPPTDFLNRDFDVNKQLIFSKTLMDVLGFDLSQGRLDVSAHPFCTMLGSYDVRMTTRYLPGNLFSSIFSVIHESGHAFYDLGFPRELHGTSLAEGASMGIHESQSRLWENVIGRSRSFWLKLFPVLKDQFSLELSSVDFNAFYRAINLVEASLIRVEADELSYSLHIILRFELEKALFNGKLKAEDLPSQWRSKMKEYLGIEPETDADGVLQDIHWSMGAFGYFPSYALGNLYSLQFWDKLKSDIPHHDELIGSHNLKPIHEWLKNNIHIWGCRLEPRDLLKTVTGHSLSSEPFLNYIESKYSSLYGLS